MEWPRAVIFDVDGTLVDSERDGHRVAFNAAFADLGLGYEWSVEEYGPLLKVTGGKERLTHHLRSVGHQADDLGALVRDLHERKNEHFLQLVRAREIPARTGVARFIDDVEASGVTLAVATTGSREWVEPLVDSLFGLARFAVVVCGDDVSNKKPDPEVYLIALQRLGLDATQAVAIEDSVMGLRAAQGAGLTCVVVPNDYTASDDLSGADLLVGAFEELGPAALAALQDKTG